MRKNVVLLPNPAKQIDPALVSNLVRRMRDAGCVIRSDRETRASLDPVRDCISFCDDESLFDGADVLFVLGGDGSIIEAARRCMGKGIPIAGINFGRVGYLAEIEINELDLVDCILGGGGVVEERMMLDVSVLRGSEEIRARLPALNEAVLTNGPVPRLLSFEMYCDGEAAQKCFADGMILSTPTGSTAYSLAAGGAVIDPSMDCICTTPICPQTMNSHPVIFRGDSVLELHNMVTRCPEGAIYLSVDGRENYTLQKGDIVRIRRSDIRTKIIRVKKGGFLSALQRKLT
ncbi:MAG: NAD(+)/NADH kinase [Clostridia bacterium]|nr:NAD(+)/NADH kinase [Clostridia bacterium]